MPGAGVQLQEARSIGLAMDVSGLPSVHEALDSFPRL